MKKFLIILGLIISVNLSAQTGVYEVKDQLQIPNTPVATAQDSIVLINSQGRLTHLPKSSFSSVSTLKQTVDASTTNENQTAYAVDATNEQNFRSIGLRYLEGMAGIDGIFESSWNPVGFQMSTHRQDDYNGGLGRGDWYINLNSENGYSLERDYTTDDGTQRSRGTSFNYSGFKLSNSDFPSGGSFNLTYLNLKFPTITSTNQNYTQTLPLSVNGNFADEFGNINLSGGGGGTPTLQQVLAQGSYSVVPGSSIDLQAGVDYDRSTVIANSDSGNVKYGRLEIDFNQSKLTGQDQSSSMRSGTIGIQNGVVSLRQNQGSYNNTLKLRRPDEGNWNHSTSIFVPFPDSSSDLTLPININGKTADVKGNVDLYSNLTDSYLPAYSPSNSGGFYNSKIMSPNVFDGVSTFTYPTGVGMNSGAVPSNTFEIGSDYNTGYKSLGLRFSPMKASEVLLTDLNADVVCPGIPENGYDILLVASKNTNLIRKVILYNGLAQWSFSSLDNYVTNLPSTVRVTQLVKSGSFYLAADIISGNIYKITAANTFTILANNLGFGAKSNIVFDSAGNAYMSNTTNNNVVKITPAGVKTTLGTTAASPTQISIDSQGAIYVTTSDVTNKITAAGTTSTFSPFSGINYILIDKNDIATIATSGGFHARYTSSGGSLTYTSTANSGEIAVINSLTNEYFISGVDGYKFTSLIDFNSPLGPTKINFGQGVSDAGVILGNPVIMNNVAYTGSNRGVFATRLSGKVSFINPSGDLDSFNSVNPSNNIEKGGVEFSYNGNIKSPLLSLQSLIDSDQKTFINKEYLNSRIGTTAPSSTSAAGTAGEIRVAAGYIYWYVSGTGWLRSAGTTF